MKWNKPGAADIERPKYPFPYPSRNQVVLALPQNQSIEVDVQIRQDAL